MMAWNLRWFSYSIGFQSTDEKWKQTLAHCHTSLIGNAISIYKGINWLIKWWATNITKLLSIPSLENVQKKCRQTFSMFRTYTPEERINQI